jgi:hypothetical protein
LTIVNEGHDTVFPYWRRTTFHLYAQMRKSPSATQDLELRPRQIPVCCVEFSSAVLETKSICHCVCVGKCWLTIDKFLQYRTHTKIGQEGRGTRPRLSACRTFLQVTGAIEHFLMYYLRDCHCRLRVMTVDTRLIIPQRRVRFARKSGDIEKMKVWNTKLIHLDYTRVRHSAAQCGKAPKFSESDARPSSSSD